MEHIVFEKKNLGLIALFLVLIAAVVLLTTEEEQIGRASCRERV